ncbi:hypothetical protein MASR2M44_17640 [Bacteroidota bacterium]
MGFSDAYQRFVERVSIYHKSKSQVSNSGRSLAAIARLFNRLPHGIGVDELNAYLYRMTQQEGKSLSYFKQAVYALVSAYDGLWQRLADE